MSRTEPLPRYALYEESLKAERISLDAEYSVQAIYEPVCLPPYFSVVMRTQGSRPALMEQALLCLVAQEFQDFELIIVPHDVDDRTLKSVQDLVTEFGETFVDRVGIYSVVGGTRGAPLNVGIDKARGTYIVFLDDDDLVFAHWLAEFAKFADKHPGKMIRSRCVDRYVKNVENVDIPSYVQSGLMETRARTFSLTQHFFISQTVLHSYATPRDGIINEKSFFDENFEVVEDWDFLLRNAELWGVVDTDAVTCIYNRWTNEGSSLHQHDSSIWAALHNKVFERFNKRGLLIGPDELVELYKMWLEHERFKNIAASLLKNGDGLMINKKENALSRSIQYSQYECNKSQLSRRQIVKEFLKMFVPRNYHAKMSRLIRRSAK